MQDYLGILEHLLKRWNVGSLTGLSSEAAEAQDRVCNLPARYRWALCMLCTPAVQRRSASMLLCSKRSW